MTDCMVVVVVVVVFVVLVVVLVVMMMMMRRRRRMTQLKIEINYIPCERQVRGTSSSVVQIFVYTLWNPETYVTKIGLQLASNSRICVVYNECARSTYLVLKLFCLLL